MVLAQAAKAIRAVGTPSGGHSGTLAHASAYALSVEEPSSEQLLRLLRQARETIAESQKHWGAIQHLTGDRRNQKRYEELFALLDAIIRDTESAAKTWAKDRT